jgi:DNA repair protein RecO (recombination protein O)
LKKISGDPLVTTRAMVLRLVPYRESDRVAHLFTEALGKVAALARSARTSHRRFGGAMQPFVLVDVELRDHPGNELCDLVSATPRLAFAPLANDARRLGRAGYLCELCEVLSRDRDPLPEVLTLLTDALGLLCDDGVDPAFLLRAFEVNLLTHLGVWPDCRRCARCHNTFTDGEDAFWRDTLDGVECARCAGGSNLPALARAHLVPRPLVKSSRTTLAMDEALAIGRCTQAVIRSLAPRPLRSVAFLKQLD